MARWIAALATGALLALMLPLVASAEIRSGVGLDPRDGAPPRLDGSSEPDVQELHVSYDGVAGSASFLLVFYEPLPTGLHHTDFGYVTFSVCEDASPGGAQGPCVRITIELDGVTIPFLSSSATVRVAGIEGSLQLPVVRSEDRRSVSVAFTHPGIVGRNYVWTDGGTRPTTCGRLGPLVNCYPSLEFQDGASFYFEGFAPPPPPPTPPPPPPPKDAKAPRVILSPKWRQDRQLVKPGQITRINYLAKDNSGRTREFIRIRSWKSTVHKMRTKFHKTGWHRVGWRVPKKYAGRTLNVCVRPQDPTGLPLPVRGGSVNELREFVNVSDEQWPLFLGATVQMPTRVRSSTISQLNRGRSRNVWALIGRRERRPRPRVPAKKPPSCRGFQGWAVPGSNQ